MTIKTIEHGDSALWPLMGPYFASEKIYRGRGAGMPMFSEKGTTWLVAVEGELVMGWAAIQPGKVYRLRYTYSFDEPEVFDALLAEATSKVSPLTAHIHSKHEASFAKHGFVRVGTTKGSWITVAKGTSG